MDRKQWYGSNLPRAILVARALNKDGLVLFLCKKTPSEVVCELPFVLPTEL